MIAIYKAVLVKILVLGGTRFFGVSMVEKLLRQGHDVTIATRQRAQDGFGDRVQRLQIERTDPVSMESVLKGKRFDVVYDKIAYCSNGIKYAPDVLDCEKYIYMSSTSVYDLKRDTREEDFDAVSKKLVWCARADFPYSVVKRQAECALWQQYPDRNWIAVRYPIVVGVFGVLLDENRHCCYTDRKEMIMTENGERRYESGKERHSPVDPSGCDTFAWRSSTPYISGQYARRTSPG